MTPLKLTLKTFACLAMSFLFGVFAARAVGIPEHANVVGYVFAACNLIPSTGHLRGTLNTITATDVVSEWGNYYVNQGQTINDIVKKLMQKSVTEAYFPLRITENTRLRKVTASFQRVLQRFQKVYTPIGGTTFEPQEIPLYKLKIDLLETPDDLEETWLGFLADSSLSRKDWPFMKWYLSNALDQADSDMEKTEIWAGVPGTITSGTATAAGTNILGVKTQINAMNTAGTLNLITMGATPTTALLFLAYVEAMIDGLDPLLRQEIDFIFMSETNRNLFRDGMRSKYNTYYNQESDLTKMANYDIQIVWLPCMAGSTKIWFTPPWNRQRGMKKPGNEKIFQVENVDRNVKAYTDYFKGVGFWIPQYVSSNDVELT